MCFSYNPNITWDIIQSLPDDTWEWMYISMNNMNHNKKIGKDEYIRKELQGWFSQSSIKSELMASIWHPRNIHKFKYLDPDTFGVFGENEEGEDKW